MHPVLQPVTKNTISFFMKTKFKKILDHFEIKGEPARVEPYGTGHINDTYRVINSITKYPDYLLQKINNQIFKDIPGLMDNIRRVTEHLRKKLKDIPGSMPEREALSLIPPKSGDWYYKDEEGNYWRLYLFIKEHRSYDIVENPAQAYEGGRMFGKFQALLADIPGGALNETIPGFHDINKRLDIFYQTLEADPEKRAGDAKPEIDFVGSRRTEMGRILRLGQDGKIPERITHNDTKFNNVLLDHHDKGLCVIDLDTVMTGYVHYDFGDSIRTSANTASEDEKDLSKVKMDINLFEGYAKGFLKETKDALTRTEIDNLAFSAKLMPFIIGLRFLTDYIDGDNYFKTAYPDHNLVRARTQFKLVESAEEQFSRMEEIIRRICLE